VLFGKDEGSEEASLRSKAGETEVRMSGLQKADGEAEVAVGQARRAGSLTEVTGQLSLFRQARSSFDGAMSHYEGVTEGVGVIMVVLRPATASIAEM